MTKAIGSCQKTVLAVAALVILAGLGAQPLDAATVFVGTCGGHATHYETIQAAVTAVKAGSTIKVCPGNYPEQITINKNLTLTGIESGTAYNPVVVIPTAGFAANTSSLTNDLPIAAQILVKSPATDVIVSDLAVDGTGNNLNSGCGAPRLIGVYFQGASGRLSYVAARNQAQNADNFGCADSAGLGIFVESNSSESSTVTIENSTVHGYQKNGITADEPGTTVAITGNSIVGAGPIDAAQNGIQVAYGATGKVVDNTIADDDFNGDLSLGFGSGILIYGSGEMTITGNSVTNTQTGIVTVTEGSLTADHNTVNYNRVTNTHLGDGIDLCSDSNVVLFNTVFSSDEAGIHLDSSCGTAGSDNAVVKNNVIEACAGILLGAHSGNALFDNTFANVGHTTLVGETCTSASVSSASMKDQVNSRLQNGLPGGHTYLPARP